MFQPTLPAHTAELQALSDFERNAHAHHGDTQAGHTLLSGLSPTLLQDLRRFDPHLGQGLDLLEVLAAALRHGRALQLYLELDYRVVPLAVRPLQRSVDSPLSLAQLLALRLPDLRVLRVEPAKPDGQTVGNPAQATGASPLGALLWELALRGARGTLLPEIAGPAAYRVSPGADLQALGMSGSLATAVERLRRDITPLRELASWPGFDHDRATRVLNGLYLQAALIVSRSHPAALGRIPRIGRTARPPQGRA